MSSLLYTVLIYPLYLIIECIYTFSKKITNNTGISVICISIGISLLCLPLYAVAEKWQEYERFLEKKMEPGLNRIKKAFKGDEKYMMTTAFYKENNYHPLMALRSSFGLLIQIPFFIAAYSFLVSLPALQGKSFLFIRNLGTPDSLFAIKGFSINILPILMTLINIIAGAIYTKGLKLKDQLQIYIMALFFLVILYNSPSGLVLYWTMNNVFSLIKNIFYKLKNPLKSFYIFVVSTSSIILLYFIFIYNTKIANKIIALSFYCFIIPIPYFKKLIHISLTHTLEYGVQDKTARNIQFVLSCLALFLLAGISIPSALIASSPIEFSGIGGHNSPFFLIKNTIFQSAGFFLFWPICIYFLFGNKTQTLISVSFTIISLCSIVNSFIFMLPYGDISQTLSFLNPTSFKTISLLSLLNILALLIILFLCVAFIFHNKGKVFKSLFLIICLALSINSIINLISIRKEYLLYSNSSNLTKQELKPIFHLSKDKQNVILVMLDRAEGQFIPEILKEDSSLSKVFEGFKFYPNSLSFNGHTLIGSPGLFGGYEYTPFEMNKRNDEKLVDKHNEALLLLPRIFSEQADFSATVTDPSWSNYNVFTDLTIYKDYENIKAYQTHERYNETWLKQNPESVDFDSTEQILTRNLIFFSFFRESPILFRELIYNHSAYWNSDANAKNFNTILSNYSVLDLLPDLTDFTNSKSSFVSISNELTHESFYFQAPDYIPSKEVTNMGISKFKDNPYYHTMMASMKMLSKWVAYLKENNVYDNTRIIFVSDHGGDSYEDCFDQNTDLDNKVAGNQYFGRGHYHCLLLFKDFNSKGDLDVDNSFMTNADIPSLLLNRIVEKPFNPFTHKEIPLETINIKNKGVYITTSDVHQAGWNGKYTFSIKDNEWWLVKDNIFDSSNWIQKSPFQENN